MGRQNREIPDDRPAKPLAEYLRAARAAANVTYRDMAAHGYCRHNTLSQATDGRLTSWTVVKRNVDALRAAAETAGTSDRLPADLDERARALWQQAEERSHTTGTGTPRARARAKARQEPTSDIDVEPTDKAAAPDEQPLSPMTVDSAIALDSVEDLVSRLDAMVRSAGYDVSELRYLGLNTAADSRCRYLAERPARVVLTGMTARPDPDVVSRIVKACGRTDEEARAWADATRRLLGLPGQDAVAQPAVAADTVAALRERTLLDLEALAYAEEQVRPRWRRMFKSALDHVLGRAS
jgi:hypothetical protein